MELTPDIIILEEEESRIEFASLEEDSRREFAAKLARFGEEGSVLMMTEQIIASIERTELHAVSHQHELAPLKNAIQEMKAGLVKIDLDMMMRAEFRISQELHFWRLSLAERDLRVGTFDLRSFCDRTGNAINTQVLVILLRFYRSLMPSSSTQSKYDYIATKMFTREEENGRRFLRIGRDSLVSHLKNLTSEWAELVAKRSFHESAKVDSAVNELNSFILAAKSHRTMEGFAKIDLFTKIRKFKGELGELFYAPEVTAASIECNVEVGNKFSELLAKECENLRDSTKFDFSLSELSQDFAIPQSSQMMQILAQIAKEEAVSGAPDMKTEAVENTEESIIVESAQISPSMVEGLADEEEWAEIISDDLNDREMAEQTVEPTVFSGEETSESLEATPEVSSEMLDDDGIVVEKFVENETPEVAATETVEDLPTDALKEDEFEAAEEIESSTAENVAPEDVSSDVESIDSVGENEEVQNIRFEESILTAALEELSRPHVNEQSIVNYLEMSVTPEVKELDLEMFLPPKTSETSTSNLDDISLRRKTLSYILQADGFLHRYFLLNAPFGDKEKAEVAPLLEEMQTSGVTLRNMTREISGDNKAERVNDLLYIANQLLEARLRLNSAQARRNMTQRANEILAAQAAKTSTKIQIGYTQDSKSLHEANLQKAANSFSARFKNVNMGLLIATVIVAFFSFGIYFFANTQETVIKVDRSVKPIDPKTILGGGRLNSAKLKNETLIGIVSDEWAQASENERLEDLKKLLSAGKEKGFTNILLINRSGEFVGRASADSINPSSN